MFKWIRKIFNKTKIVQENRDGESYTKEEDHKILNKPDEMTYVVLAEQMGRTVKAVRQRKYYLSIK